MNTLLYIIPVRIIEFKVGKLVDSSWYVTFLRLDMGRLEMKVLTPRG
jgi:hypothetical protein